jgi:ribulose-bisphosphate carboxylase large chain
VKARNEGRSLAAEGARILIEAAVHSPALAIAMETWRDVRFEHDTVDTLDVTHAV